MKRGGLTVSISCRIAVTVLICDVEETPVDTLASLGPQDTRNTVTVIKINKFFVSLPPISATSNCVYATALSL